MKPYFIKTPGLITTFFSNQVWSFSSDKKELFLTFDDGPTPEITEWILTTLKDFNAKATFFCIGKNIQDHPTLFQRILQEGHGIGNHTYNHVKGWKTGAKEYLENILQAEAIIKSFNDQQQLKLFRPPYGKMKVAQTKKLIAIDYNIIMWSVLSADFDVSISPEKCYHNVVNNASNGSIVVFHDSVKAFKNLKVTLPRVLEYYTKKGFDFKAISPTNIAALS